MMNNGKDTAHTGKAVNFAIETRSLTKKYKSLTAVDSLELTVNNGEFFALLGVNGAGKTTTIKMLTCLTAPTSGDAYLNGHSIETDRDEVKRITNVSPQETAVAPMLTVRENLEFISGIYGASHAEAVAAAEKMMAEFHLTDRASTRACRLSGGYQRRLSIAMGLISNPEILFLDEPTLGLDVIARRELWDVMRALKGRIAIILTTHYLEEAEALADRIGIMADGRLRAVGTAAELIEAAGAANFEDAFISLAAAKEKI